MTQDDGSLTYTLSANAYTELLARCRSELPNEACGLLIGSNTNHAIIDGVLPIKNVHPNPRSAFAFEPAAWISAMYQLQVNKQHLVGYYHSHPRSIPIPSTSDSAGSPPQAGAITLIVSFFTHEPVIRAYWKPSDEWLPVELCIEHVQPDNKQAD
ncbi:proteasome lid subunit RPN8/RPN11 [Paenibacillus cellulosilyticus]|uniref:Proteasome lid subunit RPN8/RPN11 n=1 Tax=Paenibacillus cellulosilyticus TaxID=375489 RepID=A0A2V2YRN2_9BACL|nr:M67 family metallopeptidase [Paenibacillus cellulosilyticus]PWV99648.1 proteasome lid subunit RPN8/RPN11 [Paenibacillus cellulosilyticus]QKS44913.1 M67 family metallopeptidase [Paenibacillus cellulosilyticus]